VRAVRSRERMKLMIDLDELARTLPDQVTIKQLAARLAINTRQAGKVLARLERLGYYRRVGRNTYKRVL